MIKTGMLAKSLAGHDKEMVYFIQSVDNTFVYLVDGRIRTIERPKKKKIKHIQVISQINPVEDLRNETIKKIIKEYKKSCK